MLKAIKFLMNFHEERSFHFRCDVFAVSLGFRWSILKIPTLGEARKRVRHKIYMGDVKRETH